MRRVFYAVLLLCGMALPASAFAQSLSLEAMTNADPFTLSVEPRFPAPRSEITVSALSGNLDLRNAVMTITSSGKNVYKGNVRPVAVPVGAAGTLTKLMIAITVNGETYEKSVSVRPQDVVLALEPQSTAPPLYLGKPLVPLSGSVRIIALATLKSGNAAPIDPSALSYAWTVDGATQASLSGIGKSSVIVAAPLQYRQRSVSVVVQSQDGNLVGGASLSFSPQEPRVRIYANDPLQGIRFERALTGTYAIRDAETTLYAAPYFFPTTNGPIAFDWYVDGDSAQKGSFITLRPSGTGEGSALLSLLASAGDTIRTTATLPLAFGASPDTNFFGL